jgi:hypothetical protein
MFDSRAQVKRVLYMAAGIQSKLVIRTFYAGLRKRGKYRGPAVTVCTSDPLVILNAILSPYRLSPAPRRPPIQRGCC